MTKISLLAVLCVSIFISLSAGVPPTILSAAQNRHIAQLDAALFSTLDRPYHLTGRVSSDGFESYTYSYDEAERLICISEVSDMQVRDSLTYNSDNQVVRIDGYQWLDQEWRHIYYVEYTYDEQGNRISRSNYNNFSDVFVLGGIYEYIYEQNVLVRHNMYLGNAGNLYETCYYIHDANGKLATELYLQDDFGTMDSMIKISYSYNENGKLSLQRNYQYDEGWIADGTEEYVYDTFGNCVDHSKKNKAGSYTDRRLYELDPTVSTDQVLLPTMSPEMFLPEFFNDVHRRALEHWYTLDADYVLQYVCDYRYLYNGQPVGICNRATEPIGKVYPNPTTGLVYLPETVSSNDVVRVSVWDMQGRKVQTAFVAPTPNTIDLSVCSPGIYVLRVELSDGSTSFAKVVKK